MTASTAMASFVPSPASPTRLPADPRALLFLSACHAALSTSPVCYQPGSPTPEAPSAHLPSQTMTSLLTRKGRRTVVLTSTRFPVSCCVIAVPAAGPETAQPTRGRQFSPAWGGRRDALTSRGREGSAARLVCPRVRCAVSRVSSAGLPVHLKRGEDRGRASPLRAIREARGGGKRGTGDVPTHHPTPCSLAHLCRCGGPLDRAARQKPGTIDGPIESGPTATPRYHDRYPGGYNLTSPVPTHFLPRLPVNFRCSLDTISAQYARPPMS